MCENPCFSGITLEAISACLSPNPDFVLRRLVPGEAKNPLWLMYLDSMCDKRLVDQDIVAPLCRCTFRDASPEDILRQVEEGFLFVPRIRRSRDIQEIRLMILQGCLCLQIEGTDCALIADTRGYPTRAISEPPDEEVAKGARDAFVETLNTNVSLLRRRLPSEDLRFVPVTVGRHSHTLCYVVYLQGIVPDPLPEQVKEKLSALDVDAMLYPGMVEEALSTEPLNPFPQYLSTQRPDRVCLHLTQGGVAVLCDGFSNVTLTPATLGSFLINMEEYNYSAWFASFLRLMRLTVMLTAILLPAFYVAISTFHVELLPAKLALFIQSTKEGVPLSTFQETLLLLFINEMLLEAGMRVPKAVGQTVTIIGGLVVGDAAVSAHILSPVTLVLVALSVIAGLNSVTQDLSQAMRLWRFAFLFAAWSAGLVGILLVLVLWLFTLARLEVFGVPYLSPSPTTNPSDQGDSLIRLPLYRLTQRLTYLGSPNRRKRS